MVGVFVLAMAALSVLGVVNQDRLLLQDDLLVRKSELIVERGELRSGAESIVGAAAVGDWARAHGMVAALDNESVIEVAYRPGPTLTPTATGLEVETRWR
jgi:hypothetical protein